MSVQGNIPLPLPHHLNDAVRRLLHKIGYRCELLAIHKKLRGLDRGQWNPENGLIGQHGDCFSLRIGKACDVRCVETKCIDQFPAVLRRVIEGRVPVGGDLEINGLAIRQKCAVLLQNVCGKAGIVIGVDSFDVHRILSLSIENGFIRKNRGFRWCRRRCGSAGPRSSWQSSD